MENWLKTHFKADWETQSPITVNGLKRRHLYSMFYELGFKKGAEIGVATGKNSRSMLIHNPNLLLFCIDPWKEYSARKQTDQLTNYATAKKILRDYEKNKRCVILKQMSAETWGAMPNEYLNFVYIDGNHEYPFVRLDLWNWTGKVKRGGIVSGHDYRVERGVTLAVDEFVIDNRIDRWFLTDERCPTYFWRNP